MIEEWFIGLIKAISWLYHCWKNFYLDLSKYFHGVEDGFESTSRGLNIGLISLFSLTKVGSRLLNAQKSNF